MLQHFIRQLRVPVEKATPVDTAEYIDFMMGKRLHPKTINCHLGCIRIFYDYLHHDEGRDIANPVKKGVTLRLPTPLPRYLKEEEVDVFFSVIKSHRDRAMFV